jgi:site-specific DNA recombinase
VPSTLSLTREQIATIIDDLGDLITALKDAEPDHKFEVYRALQLKLIYEPETETVRAYVDLDQHRGVLVRVRGGT